MHGSAHDEMCENKSACLRGKTDTPLNVSLLAGSDVCVNENCNQTKISHRRENNENAEASVSERKRDIREFIQPDALHRKDVGRMSGIRRRQMENYMMRQNT
jgi:hypothetical protein